MIEKYLCVCGKKIEKVTTEDKSKEGKKYFYFKCPILEVARKIIGDAEELGGEIKPGHKLYELVEAVREKDNQCPE